MFITIGVYHNLGLRRGKWEQVRDVHFDPSPYIFGELNIRQLVDVCVLESESLCCPYSEYYGDAAFRTNNL